MKKSTITCDMEGRILTMNDGAVQIFGYSKEEIIGKKEYRFSLLVKLFYKMLQVGWKKLLKKENMLEKHIF
jgi:PAS domain S-box-containing protein